MLLFKTIHSKAYYIVGNVCYDSIIEMLMYFVDEKHLSVDSCLCDGCFRFIDRKVNCPSSQRPRKPTARRGPLAGTICAVQDCSQAARHSVRRKWLIKLKKSIGKKVTSQVYRNIIRYLGKIQVHNLS